MMKFENFEILRLYDDFFLDFAFLNIRFPKGVSIFEILIKTRREAKGGDTLPAIHALTHAVRAGSNAAFKNFAHNHCQNRLPALFDFHPQ